jgi:hypothetical protein
VLGVGGVGFFGGQGWFFATASGPRACAARSRGPSVMVVVHDGVFSPPACALLHTAAISRGLGHTLFARAADARSLTEVAVCSYLDAIGDDSPYVEFWSRQEWKHIEAHADVDERRAATSPDEPLRYPQNGHVLYLAVGERVRGPTCVWQPAAESRFGTLSTVPAVSGRVLRFDGHLQHAVPRPADVWLAPFAISPSGTADELVRSVVLFNTWHEPPLDVEREAPPRVALHDEHNAVRCAPRSCWVDAPHRKAPPSGADAAKKMKLWLLGDEARRGRAERTLALRVDGAAVAAAFTETVDVTTVEPPPADQDDQPSASPSASSRAHALAAALQRAAG